MKKKTVLLTLMAAGVCSGIFAAGNENAGISRSNMDLKVKPSVDFARYATGGWCDANPIPDEFARYGSFDKLRDENQRQIRELVQEMSKKTHAYGTPAQKIGDLYRIGNDSIRLNKDGAAPVRASLTQIKAMQNRSEIIPLLTTLRKKGMNPFFAVSVGPDDKNSAENIFQFYQGGLNMGDRDYYLQTDEASVKLRAGYQEMIRKQFVLAGYTKAEAEAAVKAVMKIETDLAKAHFTKETSRIPELNYHKYPVNLLNDSVGHFEWTRMLTDLGAGKEKFVNVSQVAPLTEAVKLINKAPLNELKLYLAWCQIRSAAGYLSDAFVANSFDFYGKQMSGAKVNRPRWKRVLTVIDGSLGEEVGKLYTAEYFPPQAKERMLKLVDNLKISLGERIDQLAWMSPETKAKAHEKLNAFIVKIGYPDTWKDYSSLEIKNDSYYANVCRANAFDYNYTLSKLGKPADKTEWQMTPQTVNAYYNPTTNEICFPAGILQPPFFYLNADDAVNYGAIGVVIGHEMTHGFDDQGSKYDKDGNMADWWTSKDAEQFNARTKVLEDFFNNIVISGDLHANGRFTLGENIADNGGLQIAYNAFLKTEQGRASAAIDGFTPAQRFYIAYASLWASNIRDAEKVRLTKQDPHSLAQWRINGALPHIGTWYEAFGIGSDSPLYLAPEKRASIW